jgi:DNA helicase IV/ribosomal protein L37AE/L43A
VHPELAAEQAHVDRAYDRLEELERLALELAEAERREYSKTFAGVLERDVRERAGLRRRAALRLGGLNLCFGRIDCEGGASYHLGRVAVADEHQEPLIVDWRAPIAEPFYRATPADPLGLRRRRHLLTKGRKVLRLDDEVFGDTATSGADDPGEDDLVLVGEAALLDALRRARTGRMADIVSTIQAEQDRIIRAPLNGLVVVQGGPGTGKTAVALHRAAYLLYTHRFPLEEMGVLFVGPNPVFLRYIERVLPTLGESGCRMATADELVDGFSPTRHDPPEVTRLKGDARMADVVAAAVRSRQRPLRKVAVVPFGAFELKLGPKASTQIVERARAAKGRHNERRPLVEELVLGHLVRQYAKAVARAELAGLSPRALEEPELRDSLNRSRDVRRLLDRLWPVLTPARLLTDLFGVPALLHEAATGILDPDEEALLQRSRPGPDEEATWSAADLPLLDEAAPWLGPVAPTTKPTKRPRSDEDVSAIVDRALADQLPECPDCESELTYRASQGDWFCEVCRVSWPTSRVLSPEQANQIENLRVRLVAAVEGTRQAVDPELRTYGHVVVDEAQDLSPMQWRLLARRCPSGSMTIVGDLGQASGHWAPGSWQEVIDLVPAPRADVVELTVNYRTPSEVMAVAARVLAEARPDLTPARSVRDAGVRPRAVPVGPAASLVEAVVAAAAEESAAVDEGKVAVICPEALVAEVGAAIGEPADGDLLSAPISALSLDDAKGLEFDAVVVADPAAIAAEHPHGLGALYVALTRTTTRLALVHPEGSLPPALAV